MACGVLPDSLFSAPLFSSGIRRPKGEAIRRGPQAALEAPTHLVGPVGQPPWGSKTTAPQQPPGGSWLASPSSDIARVHTNLEGASWARTWHQLLSSLVLYAILIVLVKIKERVIPRKKPSKAHPETFAAVSYTHLTLPTKA